MADSKITVLSKPGSTADCIQSQQREQWRGNNRSRRSGREKNVCFICGLKGHWARDCPTQQYPLKYGPSQYRGEPGQSSTRTVA